MRHVATLAGRELAAFFLSPMAYLVLLAFQAIAALNFWELVERLGLPQRALSGSADPMVSYLAGSSTFWVAVLFAVPILTMRLIAEERRSGTLETLLTAPVTEVEVILGKWLAGVVMFLALLVPFFLYLPFLYVLGRYPFDLGPVLSLAIGLTTSGSLFIAVGLLFSTLSRNQILAAVGTFVALFLLIVLTYLGQVYAEARQSDWAEVLGYVAVLSQVAQLGAGLLDLRFLVLHLSGVVFVLVLCVKILKTRETR